MRNSLSRSAFTIVEILIVIAIISLISMLLYPTFARVRESAYRTNCQSNLHSLGLAALQYAHDYDELMNPLAVNLNSKIVTWPQLLIPYHASSILECPSDTNPMPPGLATTPPPVGYSLPPKCSYAMNVFLEHEPGSGLPLSQIQTPEQIVRVVDSGSVASPLFPFVTIHSTVKSAWILDTPDNDLTLSIADNSYSAPSLRHNGTCNALFIDGHVQTLRIDQWYYPGSQYLNPLS